MVPRLRVFICLFCGFLAAAPVTAAPALATNPAITFFSSVNEEPFARLDAASIGPRHTRHGPFRLPAPGVEIEAPALTLHDEPCTPEDWTRLLRDLAAWHRLPGSADLLIILPDSRVFVFLQPPSIGEKHLAGPARPLSEFGSPTPRILHIAHGGGERLGIELRSLPVRATPPAAGPEQAATVAAPPPGPFGAPDAASSTFQNSTAP